MNASVFVILSGAQLIISHGLQVLVYYVCST